jgi:hypothetical protein
MRPVLSVVGTAPAGAVPRISYLVSCESEVSLGNIRCDHDRHVRYRIHVLNNYIRGFLLNHTPSDKIHGDTSAPLVKKGHRSKKPSRSEENKVIKH